MRDALVEAWLADGEPVRAAVDAAIRREETSCVASRPSAARVDLATHGRADGVRRAAARASARAALGESLLASAA